MQVGAGVQAGARRAARRGVGPVIGEEDAPGRQGIQARSLAGRDGRGRTGSPPAIGRRDEEHVAAWGHALTLAQPCPRSYVSRFPLGRVRSEALPIRPHWAQGARTTGRARMPATVVEATGSAGPVMA